MKEVSDDLILKARKLIDVLTEKKSLKNAISKKEIEELEKTLKRIENKGLKGRFGQNLKVNKKYFRKTTS